MSKPSPLLPLTGLLAAAWLVAAADPLTPLPDDPAATATDRAYITRTIELAAAAAGHGNTAYGALLVKDGKVLMEFENEATTTRDVTKHAETGLLSAASRKFGREALAGAVLYTSTEPCVMCCGAIRAAGIKEFVYGTTALQVSRLRGTKLPAQPLACREIFTRASTTDTVIRGPVLEAEGLSVHAVALAAGRVR